MLQIEKIEAIRFSPPLEVAPEWIRLVKYVYGIQDGELTVIFRAGKPIAAEKIKEKIDFTK